MSVYDLEDAELSYAPPFGSAKDPVNMAGFVAANVLRGDVALWEPEELATLSPEQVLRRRADGAGVPGGDDRGRDAPAGGRAARPAGRAAARQGAAGVLPRRAARLRGGAAALAARVPRAQPLGRLSALPDVEGHGARGRGAGDGGGRTVRSSPATRAEARARTVPVGVPTHSRPRGSRATSLQLLSLLLASTQMPQRDPMGSVAIGTEGLAQARNLSRALREQRGTGCPGGSCSQGPCRCTGIPGRSSRTSR